MSTPTRPLLPQTFPSGDRLLRPIENFLALRREPHIALAALHDGNAQFFFKMANTGGKSGLRYATDLRRACEVLLSRERDQVFELTDEHGLVACFPRIAGRHQRALTRAGRPL